jgi:hypothetical protein
VPGEIVVRHGVTIIGYKDLPSRLAKQASTLYATNLLRLTDDLVKTKSIEGDTIAIDMQDEVLRGTTVINKGEVTWPPPPPKLSAAPPAAGGCEASRRAAEGERSWRGQRTDVRHEDRRAVRRGRAAVPVDRTLRAGELSSDTSRCSCWRASSATWWCGT